MKKAIILILAAFFLGDIATAQNPSAILDLESTNQGVLVPRMTEGQRTTISSPTVGLLIFQTDGTAGFYYYSGSTWVSMVTPGSAPGQMQYWNGTAWVIVPPGINNQTLTFCSGVPT